MAFGRREGRGDRYFRGGQNISLGAARNWRASMFKRGRWTVDDEASCVSQTRRCTKIFYIASHMILSSKLFVVYLIFSLCFERQNGVTRERMVFELLEHLHIVNMQLVHECRV